jgi:two-component system, NtrC family, sensor kinase
MKLARFKYFPHWDWVIASSVPESELLATTREVAQLNRRANLIATAMTLLAFVVTFVAWTLVSRKMQQQAADLATTNGTLSREMHVRLRMEAELRHRHKLEAVGRLASGVAHEINTPVQYVQHSVAFARQSVDELLGLVEELNEVQRSVLKGAPSLPAAIAAGKKEDALDLPYLNEHLPKALNSAREGLERIAEIVRSMKQFAHPGSAVSSPADLNDAIRNTLLVARGEYKHVARVELELGELPQVKCHVGEINQALLNIIVNAAHAIGEVATGTDRKGVIRIRTFREDTHVVVAIADTGGGIPDDIRDRIFDPFFTTKEVGKGTGQGLYIARSIVVEKHGGHLTLETQAGVGTTFFIRLPIDGSPLQPPVAA